MCCACKAVFDLNNLDQNSILYHYQYHFNHVYVMILQILPSWSRNNKLNKSAATRLQLYRSSRMLSSHTTISHKDLDWEGVTTPTWHMRHMPECEIYIAEADKNWEFYNHIIIMGAQYPQCCARLTRDEQIYYSGSSYDG